MEENPDQSLLATVTEALTEDELDLKGYEDLAYIQATVFLEDAMHYRSIHHQVDRKSLILYRFYYSNFVQWSLYLVIAVNLGLAFFESPSSLTVSSDPTLIPIKARPQVPCIVVMSIEFICVIIFGSDCFLKMRLSGRRNVWKSKWLIAYVIIIVVTFIDWIISASYKCHEKYRIRRIFRPFFLLQNSTMMKKIVKGIKKTLPQIFSVLVVLCLHLLFFSVLGMLFFPPFKENSEGRTDFGRLNNSIINLLVLLTTANNPDVTMPAYRQNRLFILFFMVFLTIGLYCLLNMLTAVIYNQFRGSLLESMQSSYLRRRIGIQAAFEILYADQCKKADGIQISSPDQARKINIKTIEALINHIKMDKIYIPVLKEALQNYSSQQLSSSQFHDLMDLYYAEKSTFAQVPAIQFSSTAWIRKLQRLITSQWFNCLSDLIALTNTIFIIVLISGDISQPSRTDIHSLWVINCAFSVYYCLEQMAKLWSLGIKRFLRSFDNIYNTLVTISLTITELVCVIKYSDVIFSAVQAHDLEESWNCVQVVNILVVLRFSAIVFHVKQLSFVYETLLDTLRNLKAMAGVLIVIYYVFAIIGMELFTDSIPVPGSNESDDNFTCGTYQQLNYYAINFNDFASAIVILWNIMIVNNWHVFLRAYRELVSPWAQLYFIAWYLVCVIICLNVFIALILEAFITRWDTENRAHQENIHITRLSLHKIFRNSFDEPSEEALRKEIEFHEYLGNLYYCPT